MSHSNSAERLVGPKGYAELMGRMCKVNRLELGPPGSFEQPRTRTEVLDKMEERVGLKGRAMLEAFSAKLDTMESDKDGEGGSS